MLMAHTPGLMGVLTLGDVTNRREKYASNGPIMLRDSIERNPD
jgi:hypothetical protein